MQKYKTSIKTNKLFKLNPINKLKIMSNDNVLTLQIENSIYKLQYKNPKQNNLLIKKIYNEKIYFNKEI